MVVKAASSREAKSTPKVQAQGPWFDTLHGETDNLTARGRATRLNLVEGAVAAFSERGYHATRVSDIAENAGVSLGNFYRHFEHKDAIFLWILKSLYNSLLVATGRTDQSGQIQCVDDLAERNLRYLKFYAEYRRLFRAAQEAAAGSETKEFLDIWLELRGQFINRTTSWLRQIPTNVRAFTDEDVEQTAEALGAMSDQYVYRKIALVDAEPSSVELKEMARLISEIWWRVVFVSNHSRGKTEG